MFDIPSVCSMTDTNMNKINFKRLIVKWYLQKIRRLISIYEIIYEVITKYNIEIE